MRMLFAFAVCCGCAIVLGAADPPRETLDLSTGNSRELVATLHTAGAAVVSFDYVKDGCFFSPNHSEPCFTFDATNGTDSVPIQGCVPNTNARLGIGMEVGCRAGDYSAVKLVAATGGNINLFGGNGGLNRCSPVPVTIEVHGEPFAVGAWDGCTETITCAGAGMGQLDVDKSDIVSPTCSSVYVVRH